MDPTINPTPNSNPATPAMPGAPVNPAPTNPAPVSAPNPAPTPVNPAPTPATAAGGMTTPPVNPIIQPGGVPATDGLAATDPITMPEPAPAPDPIEEELKAPMRAAAPAPGSIGSAVSGPAASAASETAASETAVPGTAPAMNPFANDVKQTPSVAFNDPATQPDPMAGAAAGVPVAKKKSDKKTLIALIAVAGIIVIILAVILIVQLVSDNSTTPSVGGNTAGEPVELEEEAAIEDETEGTGEVAAVLSCTRTMTMDELAKYANAASGAIGISAGFDDENMLVSVSLAESVVYNDGATGADGVTDATVEPQTEATAEPTQEASSEITAEELDSTSALQYYLPVDKEGGIDMSQAGIQANYESLGFVCEV